MKSAVITPCSHFFHAGCLKKWLYVQETCPLCHCQLKNPSQLPGPASEPVQQPNPGAEQNTNPGDAAEPPGVECDNGPNVKESPSQSNGQVVGGRDSQEASPETEGSASVDCEPSPCETRQGAAFAAELVPAPEGCPARDPRVCVQL
uniref:RING-type domain-containing protein n=2 Tax=Nothoprocta perdicaria TaxID=30464 RepID=A0A8C6Z121_NOTPE